MGKRAVNILRKGMTPAMDAAPQTLTVAGATALNGEVTVSGPNTNGLEAVVLAESKSFVGGTADYDITMTQPANTTLVEVGLFFSQAGDDSGNYIVDFGTTAAGGEIVANTTIVSSATPTLNSAVSTGGMMAEAGAALAFATDYAHHVTTDTTIHCSLATPGTNTTGIYRAYIIFQYM